MRVHGRRTARLMLAVAAGMVALVAAAPAAAAGEFLDLCTGEREACELQAGTYSPSRTTPSVTFRLDDGWTGVRHYADAFAVVKGPTFLSMARDVTTGTGGTPIAPGPSGFQAYLEAHASLRIDEVVATAVGGASGLRVDLVATDDASGLFEVAEDHYNLSSGQAARFFLLDVRGTTVVLIYESETEATFDAAAEIAQPVIDSFGFGLPDTSTQLSLSPEERPGLPAAVMLLVLLAAALAARRLDASRVR